MFIGDLVKLSGDITRDNKEDTDFINNAIKEGWIWLVTSMDNEDVNYEIRPLYLEPDVPQIIQLGKELLILSDEVEIIRMSRKELFSILQQQVITI